MFVKKAFVEGYLKGMEKVALGDWSPLQIASAMALLPTLGGITTGYLHGKLTEPDPVREANQLFKTKKLEALKRRNEQLKRELEGLTQGV